MERKYTLKLNDEKLKEKFECLRLRKDVANLLEIADKKLCYWIYSVDNAKKYKEFKIPKKSGGFRKILAPVNSFKLMQRNLAYILALIYKPKFCSYAFEKAYINENNEKIQKNIISNAKNHLHKRFILNIDLEDFFPSIHFGRVYGLFMAEPYNFNKEVAAVLAQICCYKETSNKSILPQGAPTSPIISNMICRKLDNELIKLAQENKCRYSRYADDITFSTNLKEFPHSVFKNNNLAEELKTIIKNNDFKINAQKTRFMLKNQKQEVSGIIVNQKLNIERKFIKNLRTMLNNWEMLGEEKAENNFHNKFYEKSLKKPKYRKVVFGKIDFVRQVRGEDDPVFIKIWNRYQLLTGNPDKVRSIIKADNENILSKIRNGENHKVEFKQSIEYSADVQRCIPHLDYKPPRSNNKKESPKFKILRAINSFLNSDEGGILIAGVDDSGNIIGLEEDIKKCKTRDKLELKIHNWMDCFSPMPLGHVIINFYNLNAQVICEIKVKPYCEVVFFKEKVFARNGNESKPIKVGVDLNQWIRANNKIIFKCPNS